MTPDALRTLARDVQAADLYRLDDDGAVRFGRVKLDWPWCLAVEAERLALGGAVNAPAVADLCARVTDSDWATRWDDPGDYPSGAGAGPLPTRYDPDDRPHRLAEAVTAWLEDREQ